MLQPVRTKWRKAHKGRIHGTATRASSLLTMARLLLKHYSLKELQENKLKLLE